MFDTAKAVAEVEERNRLRKEVQLPLLSVEQELQARRPRMNASGPRRTKNDLKCLSALRQAVEDNMLAKLRKRRGDQQWKSTGFLSGGGFAFHVRVRRVMKRLYQRQELDAPI